MKRILSLLLSAVMLVSAMSLVDFSAFAASMPTTITSVKSQSKAFTVKWKKIYYHIYVIVWNFKS